MSWIAPLILQLALSLVWVLPTCALAESAEGRSAAPLQEDAELQDRIRWFQRLSPGEREQLRGHYREFQQMPQEQQQHMRERVKRWRELSPHKR